MYRELLKEKIKSIGMDIDSIDESFLSDIKSEIKLIEKKVKEKNKPKTITISGKAHNRIKKYCKIFNENIGEWSEKILLKELDNNVCVEYDDRDSEIIQEENIKKLEDKYGEIKIYPLLKTSKFILSDEVNFKGYSITDGYPIYSYIGNNISNFKSKIGEIDELIKIKKVTQNETSDLIFPDEKLETIVV